MGQFASVEITASFKNEAVAKKAVKAIKGLDKWIKEKLGSKEFFTNVYDINQQKDVVSVSLDSGKATNAEWQAEQIFAMLKEKFKGELDEFDATENMPNGIIYYNREEEEENVVE